MVLDAGTQLDQSSLLNMCYAFLDDKHLGGASGKVTPDLGSRGKLLDSIMGAQIFESKVFRNLDSSLDSAFGNLSVLPGTFSAYR